MKTWIMRIVVIMLLCSLVLSMLPSAHAQTTEAQTIETQAQDPETAEVPEERAPSRSTSVTLEEMRARAEAIVNYKWVAPKDILAWKADRFSGNKYNGQIYFKKGQTIVGMPYSLTSCVSLEQYKTLYENNRTNGAGTGPQYGSCCVSFVCDVFGGNLIVNNKPRYASLDYFWPSTYVETFREQKFSDIREGDAVSYTTYGNGMAHVIWISEITDTEVTIYESTPPVARKRVLKISQCVKNGNFMYGDTRYHIITRSKDFTTTAPEKPELSISDGQTYFEPNANIVPRWLGSSKNTTGYKLIIDRLDAASGDYVSFMSRNNAVSGSSFQIPNDGNYRITVRALNANTNESTNSNAVYIAVGKHKCDNGSFVSTGSAHPHRTTFRCSFCGKLWEDPNSSAMVDSCTHCQSKIPTHKTTPGLTGDPAQDVARIALSQVDYKEMATDKAYYNVWWNQAYKTGSISMDWCTTFAMWCADRAGAGEGIAYEPVNSYKLTGLWDWLDRYASVSTDFTKQPQAGDFVFFTNSSKQLSHVGVVVSYDAATNKIVYVGGNQEGNNGERVSQREMLWKANEKYSSIYLYGYGRPNYHTLITPEKPAFVQMSKEYDDSMQIAFKWNETKLTTRYNLTVWKQSDNAAWQVLHNITDAKIGTTLQLVPGSYKARVDAINGNCRDITTSSDEFLFTVKPSWDCAVDGHDYSKVATPATCTTDGYTTNTCKVCGLVTRSDFVDAPGHSNTYEEREIPTVYKRGALEGVCSVCNAQTTVDLPSLNVWKYDYSVVTESTCTVAGQAKYVWQADNGQLFTYYVSLPLTSHAYSVTVTNPGSCTEKLEEKFTCDVCGYSYTEVSYEVHEYLDNTCMLCGAPALYHGKCGENARYEFDTETETLIIFGSGAMYDYSNRETPWLIHKGKIRAIEICEGITEIGAYAFANLGVEYVSWVGGEAHGTIGAYAFANCITEGIGLELRFKDSTRIEEGAFKGCTALKSVYLEADTFLGESVFENTGITNLRMGEGIRVIPKRFIAEAPIERLYIAKGTTIIDPEAFSNCQLLDSVTIYEDGCGIPDLADGLEQAKHIYGLYGSTAQAYANKYGRQFHAIPEACTVGEHIYDSVTLANPDCENEGIRRHFCLWCMYTYDEILTQKNHRTVLMDNNNATHETVCLECTYEDAELHEFVDGVCACGATEFVAPTYVEDLKPSMSIVVGAEMSVAFTVPNALVSNYESFYLVVEKDMVGAEPKTVTFGYGEGQTALTPMPNATNPFLHNASFTGLTAKEMGDEIRATLYCVDADGNIFYGPTQADSVKDYLMRGLDLATSTDAKKTMYVDMLRYGAVAQTYFQYDTENLVDADLTEAHMAYATTEIPEAVDGSKSEGNIGKLNTSVVLKARVTLTLSFLKPGANIANMKFVVKDIDGAVIKELPAYNLNPVMVAADFDDVGAKQMRRLVTITLYEGDTAITDTVTWSVESYVASVRANSTDAGQIDLVNAMLTYGDAVAAYMATQ